MEGERTYDIFISYRTTHSDWVQILAHNLKDQSYSIFLDQWELIAGKSFPTQIHNALKNSNCAVLIATPDAADSGWVRDELDIMKVRANSPDGFFFIPVIMGVFPDLPFIETIQMVDFGDSKPEKYRKAFHDLLCGLKQQPPGADGVYTGKLKLPESHSLAEHELAQTEQSFVDKVFDALNTGMPIIILAQADTNTQIYGNALRKQAEELYGLENILHIYPPPIALAQTVPLILVD